MLYHDGRVRACILYQDDDIPIVPPLVKDEIFNLPSRGFALGFQHIKVRFFLSEKNHLHRAEVTLNVCFQMLGDDGDLDGWYNFQISINGFLSTKLDSCIEFVVVNSDSEDNEQAYEIDLTEAEQELIYALLDKQCRAYFGKGCEKLLEEARIAMEANLSDQ